MDWLAFVTNMVNKIPIERVLFPPPDNTKALERYAQSLSRAESQKKPPAQTNVTNKSHTDTMPPVTAATAIVDRPGLTTEETIAYQNRQIGKQLLAMESHYAQRMRIKGIPCDCGATKHLLYLEELCEETIPMVGSPSTYEEIVSWVRQVEPMSTEAAARSGEYDEEYPVLSGQARDFRKKLMGTLSPGALIEPKEPVTLEHTA